MKMLGQTWWFRHLHLRLLRSRKCRCTAAEGENIAYSTTVTFYGYF
jgi:hypothetical protein